MRRNDFSTWMETPQLLKHLKFSIFQTIAFLHTYIHTCLGSLDTAPTKAALPGSLRAHHRTRLAKGDSPPSIRNTRTPEAPGNEPQLRRRQRDAALVAWERANGMHDRKQTEWQKVLDDDRLDIYKHAVARLAKIYANKDHYIHQKAPRHLGKQTKQYQKQLVSKCHQPWTSPQQSHRNGFQCGACGIRVHQALTVPVIEERLRQDCPQLSIEAHQLEQRSPRKPMPKKLTRAQVIRQLLDQQQNTPPKPEHHWLQEIKGYLTCDKCGCSVHKRANEDLFNGFIQSRCIDEVFTKPHGAHSTHSLWQKGKGIKCRNCGLHNHLDEADRIILTKGLCNECKGQTQLPQLFGTQAKGSQATTAHDTQPAPTTPKQLTMPAEGYSPPAPRSSASLKRA